MVCIILGGLVFAAICVLVISAIITFVTSSSEQSGMNDSDNISYYDEVDEYTEIDSYDNDSYTQYYDYTDVTDYSDSAYTNGMSQCDQLLMYCSSVKVYMSKSLSTSGFQDAFQDLATYVMSTMDNEMLSEYILDLQAFLEQYNNGISQGDIVLQEVMQQLFWGYFEGFDEAVQNLCSE